MKKIKLILIAVFFTLCLSGQNKNIYTDDIYYSSKRDTKLKSIDTIVYQNIENNYYDYPDYTIRLKRFHSDICCFGYYSWYYYPYYSYWYLPYWYYTPFYNWKYYSFYLHWYSYCYWNDIYYGWNWNSNYIEHVYYGHREKVSTPLRVSQENIEYSKHISSTDNKPTPTPAVYSEPLDNKKPSRTITYQTQRRPIYNDTPPIYRDTRPTNIHQSAPTNNRQKPQSSPLNSNSRPNTDQRISKPTFGHRR